MLLVAWLLLAPAAMAKTTSWPGTIEAAPSDWNAENPPESGWVSVSISNDWTQQWPQHNGVVWYRLRWDIAGPPQTQGLYTHYMIHAGAISVNGVELQRDKSLIEPLSRTWNLPRFFLLPAPLLHTGSNELLIRVSGYYAYQPALGEVEIGDPELLRAAQASSYLIRQDLHWLHLGIGGTLGCFFLVLWLMRRQEAAYGWYGARQAAWFVFTVNFINPSPWPFGDTNTYSAVNSVAYALYHGCNAMFVLRFMGLRWPRREAILWLLIGVASAAMMLAPLEHLRLMRNVLAWGTSTLMISTACVFGYFAWRKGNLAQRLLSLAALADALALVHDLLVFTRILDLNFYLAPYTEPLGTIGIAITLAWTFVNNTRRIESFNEEMRSNVDQARAELSASLARQHQLELVHARLGERLNLAHDLHDGLGGMLIGNITTLERSRSPLQTAQVLDMLKGMRDDLRLIIDTASAQHYGELSLAQLLAPLRYRMSQLFELHDIETRWQTMDIEEIHMSTTASLDVLRILQEALTNVFKHSRATHVDVSLLYQAGQLVMEVRDNGVGLTAPNPGQSGGTGLRSMQARAQRLGAQLRVYSLNQSTIVSMNMPWSDSGTAK